MGTIGNTLSGYYQLANLLSNGSGGSLSSAGSAAAAPESLAQILGASSSSGSGSSDAFLLDLSPQAQQLMSGSSANGSSTSSNFVLTSAQQTAIQNILEQYKNAPYTQATFDEIQNALSAAGLSPQTLGAEDQVNSFNPTNVLLSALNGDYSSLQTPAASAQGEQTKETNYMQNILSLWKNDISSASSSGNGSSSDSVDSASETGL